jgi:osmotically-inducible protein OsmY
MNRFKLTIALVSFCCLFLLACATKVSAATNLAVISSVATQPNLQQSITHTLRSNPNLTLNDIRVQVKNGEVDLYAKAPTGFQRALAQKFLENIDGVKVIHNKIIIR